MESDDLVTEDVVSWCNVGGDGDGPRVVVGDQSIGSPVTRDSSVVQKSNSINLEEFQGGLVDSCAIAVTAGEVVWPKS